MTNLLVVLFTSCQQTNAEVATPTTITIVGSSGMRPVLQALTTAFSRQYPNVAFDLRGGGSLIGLEELSAGTVDLAASVLPADSMPSTQPLPQPTSLSFQWLPIGVDALALMVHASNPITSLSAQQVAELYTGQRLDWQSLGGSAGEVQLVSREDGSGARQIFESRLLQGEPVALTAIVMPTSLDVADYVAHHPQAIGYVSSSYLVPLLESETNGWEIGGVESQSLLSQLRVVTIEGQVPTHAALRSGGYLLTHPIYLVSKGRPQGWTRQFVEFVRSPAGQSIVGRYGVSMSER